MAGSILDTVANDTRDAITGLNNDWRDFASGVNDDIKLTTVVSAVVAVSVVGGLALILTNKSANKSITKALGLATFRNG